LRKIVEIDKCNHCRYFDNSWGTRCFHSNVTKPHPEGCIPKPLKRADYMVDIPDWCPLETIRQ
jgi:hypothetical protein